MDKTGIIFAVLASVAWGMLYVINHKILISISPILLLALSSIITTILLLPILILHIAEIKIFVTSGTSNLLLMLLAQLLLILATFSILSSIKALGAAPAAIIEISYPFFVIIFSLIWTGGNVKFHFYLGSTLIMLGSFILVRYG
jgi:drug/metabolite transporter (DMT)-like permease